MEKEVTTHSKAAVEETRFMEETITISSRAMAIGTLFMAAVGMTRSTVIEGLIGSGVTKEMTFFTASVPAQEQTMAATESMEAPVMTPFRVPTNETPFTGDPAMIHCVATLMLTNYLATVAMTFSTEGNLLTTSLEALALMSTTSENRTKRMSIKTPFISATDIHSATHRKLLFRRTQLQRGVHSPLPTGLI